MKQCLSILLFFVMLVASGSVFAQQNRGKQTQSGASGVGLNSIFNFSLASNEVEGADDVSNSNMFLRLEPQFEYFVIDGVPITISAGWLRRSISRADDSSSASNDFLSFVGTGYHLNTTPNFAVIFAVGLGGYLGASENEVTVIDATTGNTTSLTEKTSTLGFGGTATLGAGYQFGKRGQFRAGVTYTGLFGNETLESTDTSLGVTTHNIALNVGLFATFGGK